MKLQWKLGFCVCKPENNVNSPQLWYALCNFSLGGYYVYIEASAPRRPNDTAQLISPAVSASSNPRCLTFWYFMYGAHVNSLNIYISVGANLGSPVWTRKGTQGNRWNQAQVTLTNSKQFNVRLSYLFTFNWQSILHYSVPFVKQCMMI